MLGTLLKNKISMICFLAIVALGALARYLNGSVYSETELLELFGTLQQSGLYLGSAIATSSGTTLALMLTMVGLVRRLDHDFDVDVYRTVALIGVVSTICLIMSVVLLMILTLPIGEFDGIPQDYYRWLYNITFGLIVLISALSVSIVTMLLGTILNVI